MQEKLCNFLECEMERVMKMDEGPGLLRTNRIMKLSPLDIHRFYHV